MTPSGPVAVLTRRNQRQGLSQAPLKGSVEPLESSILRAFVDEAGAERAAVRQTFLKPTRSGRRPLLGNEFLRFDGGSVSLATQEGRNIENVLLDRIMHRRGPAVRIEALRNRLACIFRSRRC